MSALYLALVLFSAPGMRHLRVDVDLEGMYASFSNEAKRDEATLLLAADPGRLPDLVEELRRIPGVLDVQAPDAATFEADGFPEAIQTAIAHTLNGKPNGDAVPVAITVVADAAPLDQIRALTSAPMVGMPAMNEAQVRSARSEQKRLVFLLAIGLGAALMVVLRRPLDVLVVVVSVGTSALALTGTIGWLGLPLGGPNLMLMPLVVVLGLADALHLLRKASSVEALTLPAPERAFWAVRRVAAPCALTSLTTALAFLALLTSESAAIRQFGMLAAYGMLLAFLGGLLVPTMVLAYSPTPGARPWIDALTHRLATTKPSAAWLLVLVLLFWPASWVVPDLKLGGALQDQDPALLDQRNADRLLGGAFPLRLRLETGVPDGTADVDAAQRLLQLHRRLEQDPAVGSVISYIDPLDWVSRSRGTRTEKLLARRGAAHSARQRKYNRVHRRALTAGADDTPVPLFDEDRSAFWVYVRYRNSGARSWTPSIRYLEGFNRAAPTFDLDVEGYVPLAVHVLERVPAETARVVGLSLLSAILVVGIRHRRLRPTLLLVPILLGTVLAAMAMMGVLGQPLNHSNIFVLSLAVGLGVDAWLHLLAQGRSSAAPAILWTTWVLAAGFLVLQLSTLPTVRNMGRVLLAAVLANAWLSLTLDSFSKNRHGSRGYR